MYPSGIARQDSASDGSFVNITPLARLAVLCSALAGDAEDLDVAVLRRQALQRILLSNLTV